MKLALSLFIIIMIFVPRLSKFLGITCNEKNCECIEGKCNKCLSGFFLSNNNCLRLCPVGTFADNFSNSCMLRHRHPFYIKAFTENSCLNQCGKVFEECRLTST